MSRVNSCGQAFDSGALSDPFLHEVVHFKSPSIGDALVLRIREACVADTVHIFAPQAIISGRIKSYPDLVIQENSLAILLHSSTLEWGTLQ